MKLIRKSRPKLIRGLLSLSVLLGSCAMWFPLPLAPLPRNSSEKDSSEPFPCQNRPCGCRSAEQCWKKCCCFDDNQKIAWAKANNVRVPEFVLAAAEKEKERESQSPAHSRRAEDVNPPVMTRTSDQSGDSRPTLGDRDLKPMAQKSAGGCDDCAKNAVAATTPSRCEKAVDSKGNLSVAATRGSCESCKASAKSPEARLCRTKPARSKWVLAIYAAACQGQGPPAFCFPTSIIPERITLVIPTVAEIETISLVSERLLQASLRPPLPPPKIV